MIRLWCSIANKLGITQEEAILLHGLLRGWLNVLARRKAFITVNRIIKKFDLDETDWEQSFAQQLLGKGVLTTTEAEVFSGNYNDEADRKAEGTAEEGPDTE